jgi:hypothetical protein
MLEYISKRKGYKGQIDVVLKALATRNKTQLHYKIINDLFEELYILGLVEMNHEISSEFIKNAIVDELAKGESVSSSKISLEKKTYSRYQSPQFQSIQGFNQLVSGEHHQLTSHLKHLFALSVETCFKNEYDTAHRSIRILDTFLSDSFILDRIEEIIKNSKVFDYKVEILLLDPFSTFAQSRADALAVDAVREINQTLFQIRKSISIILKKHDLLRKEFESRKMAPQFLLEQLSEIRKYDEFNLEIKFYDLLTETPVYLISQFIMKGLLLHNRSSINSPWMILVDDPTQEGDLFDHYSRNFDIIWHAAVESPEPDTQKKSVFGSRNVFISCGRNELVKLKIKDYVERELNLNTILFERDAEYDKGIFENLEDLTDKCSSAIIILSKDDELKTGEFIARQNIIHELGYCQAKYGRKNVALLIEKGVEIPSNLAGSLYVEFDMKNIESSFTNLRGFLKSS